MLLELIKLDRNESTWNLIKPNLCNFSTKITNMLNSRSKLNYNYNYNYNFSNITSHPGSFKDFIKTQIRPDINWYELNKYDRSRQIYKQRGIIIETLKSHLVHPNKTRRKLALMVYLLISMRSGLSLIDTGKVLFLRKEYIRFRDWSATFNINDHSQKKMSLLHYIGPRLIMNALKKRDLSPLAIYPNCIIPEVLWTAFLMTNFF